MGVLALEVRHMVCHLSLGVHAVHACVHLAVHVCSAASSQSAVMNGTGGVNGLHDLFDRLLDHLGLIGTSALISERPHHNGGTVLFDIHMGVQPVAYGYLQMPSHLIGINAVGFHVALCHHHQSVFIAEIIQILIVGIMGGTDGIDIELLHQLNVLLIQLTGHIAPRFGVVVMPVRSAEFKGFSV